MYKKPKKSLGQNFLTDKSIQENIIQSCQIKNTDTVLEIGPGKGALTQWLVGKAKKVIAIELDRELCAELQERFKDQANFILLNQDILKTDLSQYKNLKVIANIPYYISTPIITHLLTNRTSINCAYIMIQKELGERIVSNPNCKEYGSFTCFTQYYARAQLLFFIKNTSFWPKPKVDSCFIELKINKKPQVLVKDETFLFKVIRTSFGQRRKALRNSLSKVAPPDKITEALKKLKLNLNSRAENLTLQDFAKLSNILCLNQN